jgi:short-subunit dehydrogenase
MVVVGSDASLGGCGRASIYTATKGYALNLAESLWTELKPFGVDVVTLIFYLADTPLLRSVLARKGIPIESINPAKPTDLVRATLEALPNGPTLTWGVEPESADTLTSPARRRDRIEYLTAGMTAFYGVEDDGV